MTLPKYWLFQTIWEKNLIRGYLVFSILWSKLPVFAPFITELNYFVSDYSHKQLQILVKQNQVKVFPNPSNDVFQVDLENQEVKSIRVFSILGQLKIESQFSNTISLTNFENGIYLMEITTKDNERVIKKILKEG